jgi:aldose 1-epimerase
MGAGQALELSLGSQQAVVDLRGGRVRHYRVAGREVLAGTESPEMFAYRGCLLAPWPNRVVGGRWAWDDSQLELPVNEPATGSALHGLVFDVDWSVEKVGSAALTIGYVLDAQPGYPFPLRLSATYELRPEGLVCSLTAVNVGPGPAPVGLGVHPYLAAPGLVDDLTVTVPAETLLETDASWRETGRRPVAATELDFRAPRRIGDVALDTGFTDVTGDGAGRTEVRVDLPDGAEVAVWAGATCRWWLLYTSDTLPARDRRRSLAVEPMTCPPNAFNSGEVDVLAPGESLRLDWGFSLR